MQSKSVNTELTKLSLLKVAPFLACRMPYFRDLSISEHCEHIRMYILYSITNMYW